MIGRTSATSRFNIDTFSEVLGLRSVEKVISKRDDFVVDALFYVEPVQKFEYRGDMFNFGGSSYCASQGVFAVSGDEIFVFAINCLLIVRSRDEKTS